MVYKICYYDIPLKIHLNSEGKIFKVEFLKHCSEKNVEILEEFLNLVRGNGSKLSIDFSGIEENFMPVLKVALEIPYGMVTTYGEISKKVFGSVSYARFVGAVLSKNPMPVIIPCHRVVDRNLRLHGFTGGIALKEKLLTLEGVSVNNGKVDRRFFAHL